MCTNRSRSLHQPNHQHNDEISFAVAETIDAVRENVRRTFHLI